ncbi:MAG: ABC transporter permease [Clostridiales bacterium]|jgi:oligopeptide transport system permease protein|nr:ABC transporter permease [Clostridiales bacterium]
MDKPKIPHMPTFQLDIEKLDIRPGDFDAAEASDKESLVILRDSVGFWKEGLSRLRRNPIAMISLVFVIIFLIGAFVVPEIYPYSYEHMDKLSPHLYPMQYSAAEEELRAAGEFVFPHIMGTDALGRDTMIRLLMGSRISLLVGIVAGTIILVIGSIYGAVAGYFGGRVDTVMMRIVDIIYSVPDILIIIILQVTLKFPLTRLAESVSVFAWINKVGVSLISIFIVFALLYWVGMARIVRGQILSLKQQEFVTAAKALGASNGRIIRRHLLTNCIGTLIVTTTLQIPSSIFTESFLSFIGIGVAAPMPSLGSLASDAMDGVTTYPHRLLSAAIWISLIILSFNLLGDGLRDAFDPRLKKDKS